MNIDKTIIINAFRNYVSTYNQEDIMIKQKIAHSYRVAEFSRLIAESVNLSEHDINTAWLIGILHDIGRFEQARRFGTFRDLISIDHAELGADILFKDGIIRNFYDGINGTDEEKYDVAGKIELAIRVHNKLRIPDNLQDKEMTFCKIIRDADKTDIFRILAERAEFGFKADIKGQWASENVMRCVYEHCCVPREYPLSMFDVHMSHCCMAFELNYNKTVELVRSQGYLDRLLNVADDNTKAGEQLMILRNELRKAWERQSY